MIEFELQILGLAEHFYSVEDFLPVKTPWLVSKESILVTMPSTGHIAELAPGVMQGCLVGSAEQGFVELLLSGSNNPISDFDTVYMSFGPCFRPGDISADGLHTETFLKLELGSLSAAGFEHIKESAFNFFSAALFGNVKFVNTEIGVDIVDCEHGIELGSFGSRRLYLANDRSVVWYYGTGVATQRLLQVAKLYGFIGRDICDNLQYVNEHYIY